MALVLSQVAVEGTVQQGLFQLVEGGELLLVDGFEALGFSKHDIEFGDDCFLFR
jgi:hypothetical protein